MYSPAQVAKRANTHPNTIRKWEGVYGEFLSRPARDEGDARLFTDEDVAVFCAVAALRKSGMPPAEVRARLREREQPPIIDLTANAQEAPQATPTMQVVQSDLYTPYMALHAHVEALARRMDALAAEQQAQMRDTLWWGRLQGAILGLVLAGFLLVAMWLLAGG